MRLEGTLDAFSLPDIFQLLSYTKKTGTLHLHRGEGAHGAVHLREGAVTGGRTDVTAQELGRRLLGAGLVDDEALASAAEALAGDPTLSLARLLAEKGGVEASSAAALAAEQVTDTVFSLLRWPDGAFAFVVDEPDPDDLGARVPVDEVVAEGQRRLAAWATMVEHVPTPDAVLAVEPAPPGGDVAASRDEWSLLSLVDGHRTVAELVALSGRGEYAVVSALAGLVSRGLLVVGKHGGAQLVRRQNLLAALEGKLVEEPPAAAPSGPSRVAVPAQPVPDGRTAAPGAGPVTASSANAATASSDRSTAMSGDGAATVSSDRSATVSSDGPAASRAAGPATQRTADPATSSTARTLTSPSAGSVIPERREPFTPARRPDHPDDAPSAGRSTGPTAVLAGGAHGSVNGATAMQPAPVVSELVERDPSINKSLLLRLIAGVRGL